MKNDHIQAGRAELRAISNQSNNLFYAVGLFSLVANLLMLTGPLYMMQVYDRVLGSKSEETLVALSILAVFLYVVMGILNFTRGRILARVAARFQSALEYRVFEASLKKAVVDPDMKTQSGLNDLETIQKFIASPVFAAFFDIPWIPIFFTGIFIFHPTLGFISLGATAILVLITVLNQVFSKKSQLKAQQAKQQAQNIFNQLHADAEAIQGMGMRDATLQRWHEKRHLALVTQIDSSSVNSGFNTLSKTFRMLLQSTMIGIGAYLVLIGEVSGGAMMAGSTMLTRALAPIDAMLQQWLLVQRAFVGWNNLSDLLGTVPVEKNKTALPKPKAHIEAKSIVVVRPGEKDPALRGLDFEVKPGQALGVIGAAGAGKSTFAKVMTGVWRPVGGKLILDGSRMEQYPSKDLARYIGYLPQRVFMFDGTIRENIAGFAPDMDDEKVIKAAKTAGAHDIITNLANGYDTNVLRDQSRLSGGQMQSIGLARALYDDPVFVVLDEPNSNLDTIGNAGLNNAIKTIKENKGVAMIITHRPSAIKECDLLMVIDKGRIIEFGPRDEILQKRVSNHNKINNDLQHQNGAH